MNDINLSEVTLRLRLIEETLGEIQSHTAIVRATVVIFFAYCSVCILYTKYLANFFS